MKSLTLALLIAAVANIPAAEAVFFPLSVQPGGRFEPASHTPSGSAPPPSSAIPR
jgi:hypothetical protein